MSKSYLERMNEMKNENHDELYPDISKVVLKLELNNSCNHQCIFCLHAKERGTANFMDESLLYRLLNEGRELGITTLTFYNNGEPFICRKLHEYIKYTKTLGYTYVFINTNGALATPNRLKEVVDAGIDSIKFSINAGTRETYKIIHGHDDFDKVIEHLEFLNKYRTESGHSFKILSTFALTKYSESEVDVYKKVIGTLVDEYILTVAHDFGGELIDEHSNFKISDNSNSYQFQSYFHLPCPSLFNTIIVEHTGNLLACPDDFYGYLTTCNLKNMTLRDAWYNDKMVDLRKKHIEKNVTGMLCDRCANKSTSPINPICSQFCIKGN